MKPYNGASCRCVFACAWLCTPLYTPFALARQLWQSATLLRFQKAKSTFRAYAPVAAICGTLCLLPEGILNRITARLAAAFSLALGCVRHCTRPTFTSLRGAKRRGNLRGSDSISNLSKIPLKSKGDKEDMRSFQGKGFVMVQVRTLKTPYI